MDTLSRILSRSILFALLPLAAFSQGYTDLPAIVGNAGPRVLPIEINSPDARISGIAIRAFNLHGAFKPVSSGGELKVTFRPSGERSILINLTYQGREISETVTGKDWLDATLRAADRVVERTIGLPGFFSGRIAIVGENTGKKEIYEGDLLFQRLRRITTDKSTSLSPRWSPDGSRILFTTYARTGFPDIYEINLNTNQRRAFATYRGVNNGAAFSPDGSRVAMILSSSGNPELYVSDPSGRTPQRLTRNRSAEASPTWSPDGRRIAVTSDQLGKPQIFIYDLQTKEFTRVRTNISGYCAEPAWNPTDPSLLAFTISQGGGFEIAVFDFQSGKSRTVSSGAGDAIEPSWLNDGRHIVYTQRQSGKTSLRVLDTVTGSSAALHSPTFGNASQASFVYLP